MTDWVSDIREHLKTSTVLYHEEALLLFAELDRLREELSATRHERLMLLNESVLLTEANDQLRKEIHQMRNPPMMQAREDYDAYYPWNTWSKNSDD